MFTGPGGIGGMTFDAMGNIIIAGAAAEYLFNATPGAYEQSTPASQNAGVFAMKVSADATKVMAATLVGTGMDEISAAPAIDAEGRIVVYGTMNGNTLPVTVPGSGSNFVAVLSSDLTQRISAFQSPAGSTDADVITSPQFTVLGSSGSILSLPSEAPSSPALLGVVNSGGFRVSPQVSPGEFVSFYGAFPGVATAGDSGSNSSVATTLNGVQVTFDGIASPLLYVSNSQINAVAPFEIAGRTSTKMQVLFGGTELPAVTLPVEGTTPAIFAITHANGSAITDTNPLQPTETLVIWAAGAGVFQPALKTGEVVTSAPWPKPVLPVQVVSNGNPLPIKFAGSAPGFVAGALQVNFKVTPELNCSPCQLQIGDTVSEEFSPGEGP